MEKKAIFAGGCFWCMQGPFDAQEGVLDTAVGYIDGHVVNPSYEEVCTGTTGHTEAIQVKYESDKVSFEELVDIFWRNIDPTMENGQFADHGTQYRTGIYCLDEKQYEEAIRSRQALTKSGKFKKDIATEIKMASTFYPGEDYHQKYYQTHPERYKMYAIGSGREAFIRNTWGKKPVS